MTPRELFGVGIRLIGVIGIVVAAPALISIPLNVMAAAQVAIGALLVTKADLFTSLCYPRTRGERAHGYESDD